MISFGGELTSNFAFFSEDEDDDDDDDDSFTFTFLSTRRSSASIALSWLLRSVFEPEDLEEEEVVEAFVIAGIEMDGFFDDVVFDEVVVVVEGGSETAVVEAKVFFVVVVMSSESESFISARPFDMSPFANDASEDTGMLKLFAARRVL